MADGGDFAPEGAVEGGEEDVGLAFRIDFGERHVGRDVETVSVDGGAADDRDFVDAALRGHGAAGGERGRQAGKDEGAGGEEIEIAGGDDVGAAGDADAWAGFPRSCGPSRAASSR